MPLTRRRFLTWLGMGTYAALREGHGPGAAPPFAVRRRGVPPPFFKPIAPSAEDRLVLPDGYRADLICKWDEPLGSKGPHGAERFGFNNDFLAYFPIDALEGGKSNDEGLLWVNHEYPHPLFVSGYAGSDRKKREQILREKLSVGGSVLHVRRAGGRWQRVKDSKWTRRLTALYPDIAFTGPASALGEAAGTLANCSGGRTPWWTVLSCEENFQDCNPAGPDAFTFRWGDVPEEKIDERKYGWIVEVDPFGRLPPRKHTALGRFAHENAALRRGPSGRLVVYMGDDATDQFLYKFVSAAPLKASAPRAEQSKVLTEGTLYAADFANGRWKPLDLKRSRELRDAGFLTQGEVMVRARDAARALGATPLDRPEDCEVHPGDGSLYVALTNNIRHGNYYGQVVRLIEDDDDPEGEAFRFGIFLAGGPQSGMACPDNLAFDRKGNLWVVCDVATARAGRGIYKPFGNNGLYVVPTAGPSAGDAFQFASGPVECELAGLWFGESEDTLFLSVQHPGEETKSLKALTSHWPDGDDAVPRPSVVAVTGFPR